MEYYETSGKAPVSKTPFFVAGGTLPGTVASYVDRMADMSLMAALQAGEFCYILDTRQVGKSSTPVVTA